MTSASLEEETNRMTPQTELRTAAAKLRTKLPAFVAMQPRIVQSDDETMNALAWCEDHEGHPDAPDSTACWACETATFPHDELASLVAALLASCTYLANWLDSWDGTDVSADGPHATDYGLALAIAQKINGASRVGANTGEGEPKLLDPDCRDGKCGSCVGGPCEHSCHGEGEA